jgi:beta-glucosidase
MEIKKELEFPEGFLWGSATSAYQVEGGIENNDWAEAAKEGKVPSAGRACDHYDRYEEDFDIAKSLGQNAHRFSIEWSRIEPEEGRFDETEIEHYRKVIKALRERGIEPFVTLWHFTLPIWFAKKGGFENKKAPFYFSRYCEYVVRNLGRRSPVRDRLVPLEISRNMPRLDESSRKSLMGPAESAAATASRRSVSKGVNFWITINEPLVFAGMGYLDGKWPPFKNWRKPMGFLRFLKVVDNLVTSHNITYKKLKKLDVNFKIGVAHQYTFFESNWNPFYKLSASILNWFMNLRFLNKISRHQDFIGLNHYVRQKVSLGASRADRTPITEENKSKVSDMGWEIYPRSIYEVLMQLKRYKKPIYITENGLADAKDEKRVGYIKDYLSQVWRAIHDGVNVRGYFYWSLLDNFEWAEGFRPRFGLVEVDYKTMERKIRPSAYEYKRICETNSL